MKVKIKEKMLTSSINRIQADHAMDIDNGTRIYLNSSNTRDKIRTSHQTKLRQIKLQNVVQICKHIQEQNISLFSK